MQLKATPFVLDNGYQIVKATFFYAGLPFDGWYKVTVADGEPYVKKLGKVLSGECKKDLYITDTNSVLVPGETTSLSVEIFDNEQCKGAPKITYKTDKWQRTRHWEFYFSQQMHTDLGYTDPPENLPELYSKYLDTAQDFLKKSDKGEYGEIPYKYAVESSWMLSDGYMKKRTARQTKNIIDRVKNGDMSVGAGRFNYTMECFNAEETTRAAYYTNRYLVDKLGIKPSTTIRMFDNPAFSKSFIDIAASAGIKYGIHSMNPDRSPYHKKRLYDLFYMEGFTKGNRMLVFNEKSYGECYCFGGTHCDINDPIKIGGAQAEEALLNLIEKLEKRTGRRSYPYDKFPLPLIPNGDNKPPLEKQVEVANELNSIWKKKGYAYPKIKSAFPDEFFEDVEREYSALIPVENGTEENWWNDGWGTVAHESGINKQAGPLVVQAETLSAVNSALFGDSYPYEELYEASQRNITYDEHTYGYSLYSGEEMYHNQFEWKRSNSLGAMALAKSCSKNAMKSFADNVGVKGVNAVVFNSYSAPRTDVVSAELGENFPEYFDIFDGENKIPFSIRDGKVQFIANNVPPFGYKNFAIREAERPTPFAQECRYGKDFIENEYYRVEFKADGTIASILDKENNRELVDKKAREGFNQYRYYDDFGIPFRNMGAPFTPDRWKMYTPKAENSKTRSEMNDISVSMSTETATFRAGSIRQTVTLYNGIKRIDIENTVVKDPLPSFKTKEEAFYTFPFLARDHKIRYGLPIGYAVEGEQVYGTSTDWYSVNNWISVSDETDDYHMILSVPNTVLAQFGERRTGNWSFDYCSKKPYIYSYVLNNMWQTNFQGDQPGLATFKYSVTSGKGSLFSDSSVSFGENCASPMMCAVTANGKGKAVSDSVIKSNRKNVAVSVFKAAESNGDGMIIRFNEKCGWATENVKVTLPDNFVSFCETDIIENDISKYENGNVLSFSIPAYGVKTFRVISDKKLKKVTSVKATADGRGTKITWRTLSGAEYYEVFRTDGENELFVGATKETSLRDCQATSDDCAIYSYSVRGCASGVKGEKSNGASVKLGKAEIDVITQPVLTVVPRERTRIDLFWTPDCKGSALRYDVYRNGIKIAETSDGYVCSFRDKHVSYPDEYTYKVVTVGFDGNSASSDEVKLNHNDVFFKENPVSKIEKKTPFKKFYNKVLEK